METTNIKKWKYKQWMEKSEALRKIMKIVDPVRAPSNGPLRYSVYSDKDEIE